MTKRNEFFIDYKILINVKYDKDLKSYLLIIIVVYVH